MKLRPVTWHWDKDKMDELLGIKDKSDYPEKYDIEKIKQSGFLAQEVEQTARELGYDFSGVVAPKGENQAYSLRYAEFVVPLVKAIQEQQEMIEEQEKVNITQQKTIEELQEQNNRLNEQNVMIMKRIKNLEKNMK